MKYVVKKSFISVIGRIWLPPVEGAYEYRLGDYEIQIITDLGNGTIDRKAVAQWLKQNAGDFQEIIDFRADIELPNDENLIIEWEKEENEIMFFDLMYGGIEE